MATTFDSISKRLEELICGSGQTKDEQQDADIEKINISLKEKDDQIKLLKRQILLLNSSYQLQTRQAISQLNTSFDTRLAELQIPTLRQNDNIIQQIVKRKRTHTINTVNSPIQASKTILNLKEKAGIIRELTVVSPVKFGFIITLDDENILRDTANFDTLSTISEFSDDIDAITTLNNKYLITLKNLRFINSVLITLEVNFDQQGQKATNIDNIFCLYDTEE